MKNKPKGITEVLIEIDQELSKHMASTEKDIKHLIKHFEEKGQPPTHCLVALINHMNIRKAQKEMLERVFTALRDMKSQI